MVAWRRRGDLIERYRRAGLTSRDLANTTGLSPTAISRRLGGFARLEPEVERLIVKQCQSAEAGRLQAAHTPEAA